MSVLVYGILFVMGLAVGSFLNVVSLRFKIDRKLFEDIYGRSRCPHCGKELQWYELIPLLSFVFQLGKCRSCGSKLTIQYPLVELLSGLIFVMVPYSLYPSHPFIQVPYILIGVWIFALLALLLMSIIDFYHRIIPDSINVFIIVLGFVVVLYGYLTSFDFFGDIGNGSFLGNYTLLFPLGGAGLISYLIGIIFGALFLGALYVISLGRGMGFGDVKLAAALGLLIGWPDIALALMLAFVIGATLSLMLMAFKKKTMKDSLPFGPFIALGVVIVFFFGQEIIHLYFKFFDFILPF